MEVVIYRTKGKNGYLYDMTFNPHVDFEVLRNTRNIKVLEILTPKIPLESGELILKKIYQQSILKKFVVPRDYFVKRGLKRMKISGISKRITTGTKIPSPEEISKIEECISGKVITMRRLFEIKDILGLTEEKIIDVVQVLYCERRIKIVPVVVNNKKKNICSFCKKESCPQCCLGFKDDDILLYAADNYNISEPSIVEFKKKKMSDCQNKASEGLKNFTASSKKSSAVLWCVPASFEYNILLGAFSSILKNNRKILYITSPSQVREVEQEYDDLIDGASISTLGNNDLYFKENDITICSYRDYPCFHKAFDLVIYDERMSFIERPIENMLSIARRAVKEKGKLINITCFPNIKNRGFLKNLPEIITIPVTYSRSPMPEPLIVISRLLRDNVPQLVTDTIKWSANNNLKTVIFVIGEEEVTKFYNNLVNIDGLQREDIDVSNSKDKTALIKLKRNEVRIVISNDFSDARYLVEDANVIVMNADSDIYGQDTLIYMASMATVHSKNKCGQVIFAVEKDCDKVSNVKERIRGINKIAWENGYLKK